MIDPYEVLGLPRDADEAAIRTRYLELVRESPPDRAPERFAAIRAAYDEVRDPARRLESLLFHVSMTDSIDAMVLDLRNRLTRTRLPINTLLGLAEAQ
jgi:preprotein translocase subunit Sec63